MLRRRRFRWAFERASKINAQAPRAESAQSVLSTGHAAVTTSSKFKAQNFGAELCVRWRQHDRGMPGGGPEMLEPPGAFLVGSYQPKGAVARASHSRHVTCGIADPRTSKARRGCSEGAWLHAGNDSAVRSRRSISDFQKVYYSYGFD